MSTPAPAGHALPAARRGHHLHPHRHLPHLLDLVRSTIVMVVAALFVLTFLVQPFRIPSESMERTLLVGDFLLVDRSTLAPAGMWHWLLPYHAPRRGEIVVFHFPVDPEDHVVKRVVGVPGDRVALQGGLATVNNAALPQPYAVFEPADRDAYRDEYPRYTTNDPSVEPRWRAQMRELVQQASLRVPANSYFVLGDNRNHSQDSRYWGFVPLKNIVGTPLLIYFSLREPSATDDAPPADGRLGNNARRGLGDFARWDRMLRVIR